MSLRIFYIDFGIINLKERKKGKAIEFGLLADFNFRSVQFFPPAESWLIHLNFSRTGHLKGDCKILALIKANFFFSKQEMSLEEEVF